MASTRTKLSHTLPAATTETTREPAGRAFERLTTALAPLRRLSTEQAARVARLEAELAEARQAVQDGQQRCRPLERELEELKPRLGYEFNLPQDASLAVIGQLGVARCRAARACRGLRAAVGSARHLGAFKHRVQAVAAGGGHTVVCTGDAVFSFGRGDVGQLGYEAGIQATPRVVAGLLADDVVAAAASATSTLVCTAEGRAYWFGVLYGQQSSVPGLLGGLERVVGVAAGENHLLAWAGSGELYTWGHGDRGQLGHGGQKREVEPRLVEGLAGQQVVGADGNGRHSVACTASGRVYTFGYGKARLGHGEDAAEYQLTPRLVEGLAGSRVVAVAASMQATAAVTEAGELYTWGYSHEGALGHGQGNIEEYLPRVVAGLAGRRVAGVSAGYHHTLAWTDSGELYSWGAGEDGRLGHNSRQKKWSPRRVEGLAGKAVVGAAAGSWHSIVVTQKQEVYTFGNGARGQLGHGSTQGEGTPRQVAGLKTNAPVRVRVVKT